MGSPVNTVGEELYFCIDKEGNIFTSRSVGGDGGSLDLLKLIPRDIYIDIVGTVYDEKTKGALQSANVELKHGKEAGSKFQTDAQGKWKTRIDEVNAYNISANAQGYIPKNLSFKLGELMNDTTIYVDIYLMPVAKRLLLTGSTLDQKTIKPISAKLTIELRGSGDRFDMQTNGRYEQEIKRLGKYVFAASAEGYLNATDSIVVDDAELTPFVKDIVLQPIEVGVTVRLKNIYFDFDKTTLKSESFVELNKVVDFLKQNSNVEIEISGHTDSKGSDDYNLNLSQGRSQAVVDYLISQGIDEYRLTAHGYGETKPIDTNDTDDGRANNRRVEFTIVKT
jgi:outer membrane protein OmpA-like peptidoglycan-associated protein